MVDTIRTLSALQTLLADNTERAISEGDLRDVLYSVLGVVPYVAKTASYSATENDCLIRCDATSGAVAITLPAGASTRVGKFYIVQKTDSGGNAVSISRSGSDVINGATSKSTTTQWNALFAFGTGTTAWACFTLTGS